MLDFLFYLFYFLETNTLKREKGIHTHTHNVSLFYNNIRGVWCSCLNFKQQLSVFKH